MPWFPVPDSGGVTVRENGGADVGTRPRLNLIEGSGVTLTVADDATDDEVDVTVAATGGGGGAAPLVSTDTVTVHTGTLVAVASGAYSTVFDIATPVELLSGIFHGAGIGLRLTIDGTVVINETGNAYGRDAGNSLISMAVMPWAQASSSMKLEIYNTTGSSRDFGWRVLTR